MIGIISIFIWIGIPMIICFLFGIESKFAHFLLCGVFGVIAFAFYGLAHAARNARLQNRDDKDQ